MLWTEREWLTECGAPSFEKGSSKAKNLSAPFRGLCGSVVATPHTVRLWNFSPIPKWVQVTYTTPKFFRIFFEISSPKRLCESTCSSSNQSTKRMSKARYDAEHMPKTSFIGKKHSLKIYDQFALNTSCFWGSTGSNIARVLSCAISRKFWYFTKFLLRKNRIWNIPINHL